MIKAIFNFLLFFPIFFVCGQESTTSDAFLNHLLQQELNEDAIYYLETALSENPEYSISNDSIHYLLGSLYEMRDIKTSKYHYESIGWNNDKLLVTKKRKLIYQYFELDEFGKVDSVNIYPSTRLWSDACDSIYVFEAINVLRGYSRPEIRNCANLDWNLLNNADSTLRKFRRKSAFKAGMLSAIVPGLGKVYAGRSGQGIMAFVSAAVLGWQAVEGYQKGGVNDPRFIVFTSLFSINYIGNIWGSALSVSVNYQNHYNESKKALLASIRFGITF